MMGANAIKAEWGTEAREREGKREGGELCGGEVEVTAEAEGKQSLIYARRCLPD